MPLIRPTRAILLFLLTVPACGRAPEAASPDAPVPEAGAVHGVPGGADITVQDDRGVPYDEPFLGGFNHPRPQLVDIDGDGQQELFVQERTGAVMHFVQGGEREGTPVWRLASAQFNGMDVGEWYRFADLDGDGDVDLLTEQPFSYIAYWRNDGTTRAPRFVLAVDTLKDAAGEPIFSDRQNIPQLGDIDCNGLADLLIGRLDGTVTRYELVDGTARAVPRFELVTERFENIRIVGQGGPGFPGGGGSRHGANTMAIADHDGDGDPDLFWGDFFEEGLLLIENVGTCTGFNFQSPPAQFPRAAPVLTSGYNAPSFGDLGGDGQSDLVLGVLGGAFNPNRTTVENLYYLEGPSTASDGRWRTRSRRLVRMVDVGSESVPALVDLDDDGDLDLLVANKLDPEALQTSRVYHFENTGTRTAPAFRLRGTMPFDGRYHFAPAFGDLDGDGALDLVMGQWGAALAWYRGGAGGFTLVDSAVVTITRGSNTTPTLGDLDGDGHLDLVIGEASGALNYYRNMGTSGGLTFELVSDEWLGVDVGRRSAPHLVDLDGDGDLDLLVGSELEGLILFRNEGTARTPRFVRDETFALDVPALSAPAAGDLDGDGRLDLVVGGVGGGLLYWSGR